VEQEWRGSVDSTCDPVLNHCGIIVGTMEASRGRRVLLAFFVGILACLPFAGGKTFAELFW
jgi:hypothetical protein